ncbi:beta-lactamase [Cryobacterium roopkundense]|uniref:Beta-lactamase n=1 Tax=Cryobacterium roopkundense TaxID=1001240 RepID=A0A099JP38_9MICO|nr:MBL fold metallo-hydrolase [Cryobacterium roopkundense]KGJ80119.1 beta-lactamase [Cryobacterium roopkundense]MBB5641655.1 L-ascorbate metabolism protein UlaG (beta-lactamase superfamily) [Cryobacterium roopkundense]
MKLTKLEHAALILELSGQKLFVDPGSFTTALTDTAGTAAIVITHEHADHWTPEQLRRVLELNADVPIFAPAGVAAAAAAVCDAKITIVRDGDSIDVGPFALRFFGRHHAVIHESLAIVDNVGVLINEELYYGGDSFTIPQGVTVSTLAVPAGAPWLKISEVIDFVLAVKPLRSFPTHEMVLSRAGKDLSNARIKAATEQGGGDFFPLEPGDSLDL